MSCGMKLFSKYSLIVLVTSFALFATATAVFAHEYYPNFIGNRWRLKAPISGEERIVKITGKRIISGRETNLLERSTKDNIDKLYIATEGDETLKLYRAEINVAFFGTLIFNYNPPEIFIPYPLTVGTMWTITGKAKVLIGTISSLTVASVEAKEDVTVPAGTFRDCVKIRQDYVTSPIKIEVTTYMWFAPNVCLIKEMNSQKNVFELVEYELNYPWDVNGDRRIDISDLVIVGSHFGERIYSPPKRNNPDVNGDGAVDISDLVLIGRHFGEKYYTSVIE